MSSIATVSSTKQGSTSTDIGGATEGFHDFVGESGPMQELYRTLRKVGPSTASVLLVGESGTGKELAARTLHALSTRRRGPFVAINCGAIPETLLEGELFGHEKGAFTGAVRRQLGCFELANRGTLFLDELSAMPLSSQAKLLRALEERSFRRLRGSEEIRVDVRIVAALSERPERAVHEGRLREDLYYRINVFTLRLPPLRERDGDVLMLAHHFIRQFSQANHKDVTSLTPEASRLVSEYTWPGNVRELRNAMERGVILAQGPLIRADHLPVTLRAALPVGDNSTERPRDEGDVGTKASHSAEPALHVGMTIEQAIRELMLRTLEATAYNKTQTARMLGVSAKTVYNKLREWSSQGDAEARRIERCSRGRPRELRAEDGTARLVSIDLARKRWAS